MLPESRSDEGDEHESRAPTQQHRLQRHDQQQGADSRFLYNRCKFPMPMKASCGQDARAPPGSRASRSQVRLQDREYVFARRVWDREDGGFYALIRSCDHAAYGSTVGDPRRRVLVAEYTSGFSVREVPRPEDGSVSAVIEALYFEVGAPLPAGARAAPDPPHPHPLDQDSRANAKLANMAVKKGLFRYVVKFEGALRAYVEVSARHHGAGEHVSARGAMPQKDLPAARRGSGGSDDDGLGDSDSVDPREFRTTVQRAGKKGGALRGIRVLGGVAKRVAFAVGVKVLHGAISQM